MRAMALGRTPIDDGRWLVAATRSFHPELFVLRAREQGPIPSPR